VSPYGTELAQVVGIQNCIGGAWFKFLPEREIFLLKFSFVGPSDCMQMRELSWVISYFHLMTEIGPASKRLSLEELKTVEGV